MNTRSVRTPSRYRVGDGDVSGMKERLFLWIFDLKCYHFLCRLGDITRSFLAKRKQSEKDIHASFRILNANLHSIFKAQQKSR